MIRFDQITDMGRDRYLFLEDGDLHSMLDKHRNFMSDRIGADGGYNRWYGAGFSDLERKLTVGDETLVAASEEFLKNIEDQVPMSRGWRNVDDVVGAIPNVPAFLAGHPQCMRRRERTMRESAPLAIYMDLTSSGGINERDIEKRGVVLLALVRLLVDHRPVELWVGSSLGTRSMAGSVAWRIDTAPLDLARAAFRIGATVMSRGYGYGLCMQELGTGGQWPFDDYSRHVATAPGRLAHAFPGSELLYVPPIYLGDEMTRDPVGWIKRSLAKYVHSDEA